MHEEEEMVYLRILVAVLIITATYTHSFADTLRCRNRLISTGDSTSKVLLTCGEPLLKEVVSTHIKKVFKSGKKKEAYKEVYVEKWTYDFGRKYPLRILTFKNGVLDRIDSEWR